MPKTKSISDREKRSRRLHANVMAECKRNPDVKSLTGLAERMGLKYTSLYSPLHNGSVSALMMNDILHALDADTETVARFYKL